MVSRLVKGKTEVIVILLSILIFLFKKNFKYGEKEKFRLFNSLFACIFIVFNKNSHTDDLG